jgi:hypothetical protein
MNTFTFALPSFWPKFIGIFEVFLDKMATSWLSAHYGVFYNRNIFQIVVFYCTSLENAIGRPVASCCLVLNPVDIVQFFQVFMCNICIWLYDGVDFLSKFSVNFGISSYVVNDHSEEPRCCVCSRNQKCLKLI